MDAVRFNNGRQSFAHESSHSSYASDDSWVNFSIPKSFVRLYGGSAKSRSKRATGNLCNVLKASLQIILFRSSKTFSLWSLKVSCLFSASVSPVVTSRVRLRGARTFPITGLCITTDYYHQLMTLAFGIDLFVCLAIKLEFKIFDGCIAIFICLFESAIRIGPRIIYSRSAE